MISYSIDTTVFNPPKLPENENNKEQKINYTKKIILYIETINKCFDLLNNQNNFSVYMFAYYKPDISLDYFKNAVKYTMFPIDACKNRLDRIFDFNMPLFHFGKKDDKEKYYFQKWFKLSLIHKDIISCIINPSCKNEINIDKELITRINMIGLLNNYIYKDSNYHYLILKNKHSNLIINSNISEFVLNNQIFKNCSIKVNINIKSIDDIVLNKIKYDSVMSAYESAKVLFDDFLIFGNDVVKGIKTIRNGAGPPDRIFSYLETLKDYCLLKRNNSNIDDIYLLSALGCICHNENEEQLKDEKAKEERMLDNGNNENELFMLHLCPNTFPPDDGKSRTVRIYFKWDNKNQNFNKRKVIIGWIGRHLYLP